MGIRVFATREGLVSHKTAAGIYIRDYPGYADIRSWFCALPCVKALWRMVEIRNPATRCVVVCPVLDVGPWNENDYEYVFNGARPAAECGRDTRGRHTNKAGIDLSEGVWSALEMTDNADVIWSFYAPPEPISA